jgi:endonuclease/exonuclease/phosphatase family metal-dependent hydrolase
MRRLITVFGLNGEFLRTLEASLILLFFTQALRFLIGTYFSRIGSASLLSRLQPEVVAQLTDTPGFVQPQVVAQEISFLIYMVVLPALAIFIGRFRLVMILAALAVAGGRTIMVADVNITAATAAALTVGSGLFYIALLTRHRYSIFPHSVILALAADQLIRTSGNTLDPTWSTNFFTAQLGLFFVAVILSVANYFIGRRVENPERGLLTFWGGLGLGALLFLELSLLSLPNAVANRARVTYPLVVPALLVATLLPLLGPTRTFARQLTGVFDAAVRGWVWLLLVAFMLALGTRFSGPLSAAGFITAQFGISMIWWWLVRPQAERERNLSGLWVVFGTLIFALFLLFDYFTYEYAYVQQIATNVATGNDLLNSILEPVLEGFNTIVVPLLRGFRGLGYAVILLAAFIAALPLIRTQRRIAWRSTSTALQNVMRVGLLIGSAAFGATLAQPPLIFGVPAADSLRVGTFNIHGGYSEYYAFTLEEIAQTIDQSGASVVMLQEVEAGRLTSFGVDQSLWLARRLGMDTRMFPTNEGLQGLAVLSEVEIVFADGEILSGIGQQTGLQRVQIRPVDDAIVTVYNTWLGLLLNRTDRPIEAQEQDQQRQLDQIISIIGQHHPNRQLGYTVVGGTFNNIPDSPLIERMRAVGFNDPFAGSPIERSATLIRTGLSARVDYVWIYPEVALGVNVMPNDASDHRLASVGISLTSP